MSGPNAESSAGVAVELREARKLLASNPHAAATVLRHILNRMPGHGEALRLFGRALRKLGQPEQAGQAELAAIELSARRPQMAVAIGHVATNRLADAEAIVRPMLARDPHDVVALCLLAEIANRVGIYAEAEKLFRQALELAPDFVDAKINLSRVLFQQNRLNEAISLLDQVLVSDPANFAAISTQLIMLGQTGEYDRAITRYEELLPCHAHDARFWNDYANVLKTVGRVDDSVNAFRRALAINSRIGESWWGLANLKIRQLDADDIKAMNDILETPELDDNLSLHVHFSLGKALEDAGDYERSFTHYAAGNRLRRRSVRYDARFILEETQRSINLFTPKFFSARKEAGSQSFAPIFILGMPRAGSTLIEQILSSHSQVEGTSELPDIPLLVQRLVANRWQEVDACYPGVLEDLSLEDLQTLGDEYLRAAALHRKTDRPFFIDKLPNNWAYIGFIHLILPNARIIDARREAMACCFSNFTQHYAQGQDFSYSLTDIGQYYSNYVALLDHFDRILPGRVRRVQHEALIAEPEREIRSLLTDLGLSFEIGCLRFHENTRPVRTASAEQVRRPINRDALDRWKDYQPWLGDLQNALRSP